MNTNATVDIGTRRELFVDHYLIDTLRDTRLQLHHPQPTNVAIQHDQPWEGRHCIYHTVIKDGDLYRLYYRGWNGHGQVASACYAESNDGITFTRPALNLFAFEGSTANNIILAGSDNEQDVSHNLCPMLDTRPGVPESERYKAIGGGWKIGMFALASPDGIHWRLMSDQPVRTATTLTFDSQNVPFWSEAEGCYVFYYRTWRRRAESKPGSNGIRWISRCTSDDFINWSDAVEMDTGDAPLEEYYVNQTNPYFRAPHLYVALAARFWPGKRVVTDAEAQAIDVPPRYVNDISEGVLMTTRGGSRYDCTFLESFIRPGPGPENWVSRTNYPGLGVVPTGPAEMSLYVSRNYTLTTNHLQRCTLRTDGFISVNAPYAGGEMVTRPLQFAGEKLSINYATGAGGSLKVEIQDQKGNPIPGYTLDEATLLRGDRIDHHVTWAGGDSVAALAGRPIRLRFKMADADLYSLKFE